MRSRWGGGCGYGSTVLPAAVALAIHDGEKNEESWKR